MDNILIWMEEQEIPLNEEQKAVIAQFDEELAALKEDVAQRQLAQLIEEELARQNVSNSRLLWALLDKDKLSVEEGQLVGLREQLKALKEDKDTAFLFGGGKQQPRFVSVGKKKRHQENAARAVMGLSK